MTVHQIYEAIRSLPIPEQLRLVERVVHDVAEAPASGEGSPKSSLLGLFEQEPDIIDKICSESMQERRVRRLRADE